MTQDTFADLPLPQGSGARTVAVIEPESSSPRAKAPRSYSIGSADRPPVPSGVHLVATYPYRSTPYPYRGTKALERQGHFS